MTWLGEQSNIQFVGQTVGCPGTFMFPTLEDVSHQNRLEFPVCESFQMQFSLGIALTGQTVVSVYPRQNFLLLATADLVLLDKMVEMTDGKCNPHVIVRVATGPTIPVDPQTQHRGNYTNMYRELLKNMPVKEIRSAEEALSIYQEAYYRKGPSLIVENGNSYGS